MKEVEAIASAAGASLSVGYVKFLTNDYLVAHIISPSGGSEIANMRASVASPRGPFILHPATVAVPVGVWLHLLKDHASDGTPRFRFVEVGK